MKAKISSLRRSARDLQDAEQFIVTENEFTSLHFEDENQELEYNGKMYDIITIKQVAGKRIIYCISDKKETHLKLLAKKQRQNRNQWVKNSLTKLFTSSCRVSTGPGKLPAQSTYFIAVSTGILPWLFYDILKPPPEQAA